MFLPFYCFQFSVVANLVSSVESLQWSGVDFHFNIQNDKVQSGIQNVYDGVGLLHHYIPVGHRACACEPVKN